MAFPILSQEVDEAVTTWYQEKVRAAKKLGIKVALGGSGVVYLMYPQETEYAAMSAGGLLTVSTGYWTAEWAANFSHRRNWIYPLHKALKSPLGLEDNVRASRYIEIAKGYEEKENVGIIRLPDEYTGLDANAIATVVRNKLGLPEATVDFKLAGRKPRAVITQPPRPPRRVVFAEPEYQEIIESMPESKPLIGIGPNGRKVAVDLDSDSPHILMNAGTGGGKSVTTRTMCSQMLHNGAQMVVLDVKLHSQMWAEGLANVVYCRDVAKIHHALVALGRELARRNEIVVEGGYNAKDLDVGPRLLVLVEEINGTNKDLRRYWTDTRTKEDPKASPAVDALHKLLFMGRAVRINVLTAAQYATAAALGGPEARENFGTRILARSTNNAWRMLAPEVQPIPRAPRVAGRVHVVLGGVATETQVLFMEEHEARQWASSGVVNKIDWLSRDTPPTPPTREFVRDSHSDVTPLTLIQGGKTYSLAEAARAGLCGDMKYDALRQAKRRDPNFPEGEDGRWTAEQLQTWYTNRSA